MLMSIMAGSSAVFGDRSSGNVSADLANAARRAYFDIGGRAMGVQRGLQGNALSNPFGKPEADPPQHSAERCSDYK